jgi:hypothetical protein
MIFAHVVTRGHVVHCTNFLLPCHGTTNVAFRIRDPECIKKSRSGSGMNILDHISESLETIILAKILQFFDPDADPNPGYGNLLDPGSGIRDGKNSDPGSGINIRICNIYWLQPNTGTGTYVRYLLYDTILHFFKIYYRTLPVYSLY